MTLPEAHLNALVQMFKAFAPYECERWTYLLGLAPSKWSKITPIKVWPLPSAYDCLPDIPFGDLIAWPSVAPHAAEKALVLRCGHSKDPGTAWVPLREVLSHGRRSNPVLFEGFVSIIHGKLALVFNHEGGVCVFDRRSPREAG